MKKRLLLIILITINIVLITSLSYICFKDYNYNENIKKELFIKKENLNKKEEEVNIIQEKVNKLNEDNQDKINNYKEIESWIKELKEKM